MHIVILFTNIGSYHAARLRAAHQSCLERNWRLTAVQITANQLEHSWGDLSQEITFPLITLTEVAGSTVAGKEVPKLKASVIDKILNQLAPDVIALPGWSSSVACEMLNWTRTNKVLAILMSESKKDDAPRWWWQEQLKRWLYVRHFHSALVGGEEHRRYAHQLGMPLKRIFLGYDAVDNHYFEQGAANARNYQSTVRHRQPSIPTRPYFICLTRFLPRKNLLGLIHAYNRYRNVVGPNDAWILVICGNGEQLTEIKSVIAELDLEQAVHLPGFIPYQSLGDWYGLAEALVHPALVEQWGLVINEACAAGLPIICSSTVGARYELVEPHKNGFLFDPRNPTEMADTLVQMHKLTPEQRSIMGHYSQQLVARFSPGQFAQGLFAAIDSAMKHPVAKSLSTLQKGSIEPEAQQHL